MYLLMQGSLLVDIAHDEKVLTVQQFLERRLEDFKLHSSAIKKAWSLSDLNASDHAFLPSTTVAALLASAPHGAYLCQDEDDLPCISTRSAGRDVSSNALLCSMVEEALSITTMKQVGAGVQRV